MQNKHRIFLVNDVALLRAGLGAVLSEHSEFEVVSQPGRRCSRGPLGTRRQDLVIVDISLAGMCGLEALIEIKLRQPRTRALVIAAHKAQIYVHTAREAGADAYLLKNASRDELLAALDSILAGKNYLSHEIVAELAAPHGRRRIPADATAPGHAITRRELEVLKLIAQGNANRSIALLLGLSISTVWRHRSSLMAKLDLHNGAALTNYAKTLAATPPGRVPGQVRFDTPE